MRIWLQTGSTAGLDPSANKYVESLIRHVKEVARPDTVVDLHGPEIPIPGRESYAVSSFLKDHQAIKDGFRAQKQGYDAYAMAGTADHAYREIREAISIPVTFVTEVCVHVACLLAPKFGFLAHNRVLLLRLTELARGYGMSEHMVAGSNLDLSAKDFAQMYDNPNRYVDLALTASREVIKAGAGTIYVSGNPFARFMADHGLNEIDGIPVLDSIGVLIKVTELMVDLKKIGIYQRRIGLGGTPSVKELEVIRGLFGVS